MMLILALFSRCSMCPNVVLQNEITDVRHIKNSAMFAEFINLVHIALDDMLACLDICFHIYRDAIRCHLGSMH